MRSLSLSCLRLSCPRPRTVILGFFALFALNIARYAFWPPVGHLAESAPKTTAFIEYREEQWEESGQKKTVRRTWVPLASISPYLAKAVVVAEDSTFWSHNGFDLAGIRDALERNLARKKLSAGGSTITQQLAKNLFFSPEKNLVRKIQEALVTVRLELFLSKQRILELYLNCVEWGDGIFGAEEAARYHFGVSAARLTPNQAARLAAMLPSPLIRTAQSPLVARHAVRIQARMRIE